LQIYIPKKIATKPPIIVSCHACGTKVSEKVGANPRIIAAAEKMAFLIILPGKSENENGEVKDKTAGMSAHQSPFPTMV
jgi:poly(3-hydroxybutyrate) depolymerase